MPDLIYESMPFRDFPAAWTPHIRELLDAIAALLTPEQRAAFHLSELREEHGRLILGWNFKDPGVEATPELLEAIEGYIDRVEREVQQLRCGRVPRPAFPCSPHQPEALSRPDNESRDTPGPTD